MSGLQKKIVSRIRVCVLGAGVVGLNTAVHLLERFQDQVELTVLAERFSPHTLSDKATGIFLYSDLGANPSEIEASKRWFNSSLSRIGSIFSCQENTEVRISLTAGYIIWSSPQPEPWWKDLMFGFRQVKLDSTEASALYVPPGTAEIWAFSTYVLTPTIYLNWLMNKVERSGSTIEKARVTDLDELVSKYDVVVNCTGLSSCKELVSDSLMYPIRGQYVLVQAPWVKHWLTYDDEYIVVPRETDVVLGCTIEPHNWDDTTDESVIANIKECTSTWIPSLASAKDIRAVTGLRPGRPNVRLEECVCPNGNSLVHCYGHGGKGVVLSWGCALDIGDMIGKKLSLLASS